jgi:hypothetical protein
MKRGTTPWSILPRSRSADDPVVGEGGGSCYDVVDEAPRL